MKLIIAEKPNSAEKIARAIGDKVVKKTDGGSYFEVERKGEKILIVPAVGHLYGLKPKNSGYPVLEAEWIPSYEINKNSSYTKQYLNTIKKMAKEASDFIAATDFDVEGEVIAANILEFACNAKRAKRMKFSTLTKEDLEEAFTHPLPSLLNEVKDAGRARHFLDLMWGLSFSRALMSSIQKAGTFKILSIGRVQGPTLKILSEREKEIKAFKSTPYWQVTAVIKNVKFNHEKERIPSEVEAEEIKKKSETAGFVEQVDENTHVQNPPFPFDLTSLQVEAYRYFGFTPSQTLKIAQTLYEQALTSYPRTSSQKLPEQLNLKKIIQNLSQQEDYKKSVDLLKGKVKPREGPKEDPAHPAIHPTGSAPGGLNSEQGKLYDLIVRRFLACFSTPAKRLIKKVTVDLGGEKFNAEAGKTVEKGWMEVYQYLKPEEKELDFKKSEKVKPEKIDAEEKQTEPPSRYSPASIVKKLENLNIGTKATRAEILETLYSRGYIEGKKSIIVTPFGLGVFNVLEKHSPEILSEKLTKKFEEEMESIQEGKKESIDVIKEGKEVVVKLSEQFKKNELEIGKELIQQLNITKSNKNILGKCSCGGDLTIKKSIYGYFVGCSNYPNCKITYPLPRDSIVTPTGKVCAQCHTPIVTIKRKGKKTFSMCLDPNCKTKESWKSNQNYKNAKPAETKEKQT
ncbi:MAG: DNA topoisomerase I [Candidatus Marsarchaeota archaeon]|nr:DNA topoisomerase I [Candidatus Marsarchaeota archaeon]